MKIEEKKDFLFRNYLGEWLRERRQTENDLSNKQAMWCVCGKLATGLHERCCRKFHQKVDVETVNRLKHLLSTPRPEGGENGKGRMG